MNEFLNTINELMEKMKREYCPELSNDDLEEHGAIFYLNGRISTDTAWYRDGSLPAFSIFRKGEEAALISLIPYKSGVVKVSALKRLGNETSEYEVQHLRMKRSLVEEGYEWGMDIDRKHIINKPTYEENMGIDYFGNYVGR